ncbi:MAG TPA: RNA methyltransferase [Candidatus Limnocylindrales bacterium]|nr:RNA methyltransferase [Candidatus Limnocylindrales bacterium]
MTLPGAITSLTNPRVKAAVRLRDRRERESTGLTIVDGARELGRALEAGVEVVEAYVCDAQVRTDEARDVVGRLAGTVGLTSVSEPVIAKLAFGDRSDGVVAIVQTPSTSLGNLELGPDPLIVVLEAVEKPGNLGAILRTADGAGVDAVIAADPRTDLFNPNAVRASLGTIFTRPVAAAPSAEVLEWLAARDVHLVAARVDAERLYTDAELRGALAIVLGSETAGLKSTWTDERVEPVRIPMGGKADSLNVSVAAAVLLYEAVRQRATLDER